MRLLRAVRGFARKTCDEIDSTVVTSRENMSFYDFMSTPGAVNVHLDSGRVSGDHELRVISRGASVIGDGYAGMRRDLRKGTREADVTI